MISVHDVMWRISSHKEALACVDSCFVLKVKQPRNCTTGGEDSMLIYHSYTGRLQFRPNGHAFCVLLKSVQSEKG